MSDNKELSTKFNVNNLIRLSDKEKTKFLAFGAWNGKLQLSFGPNEFVKGKAPRKIILIPSIRYLILQRLKEIRDNPKPGMKSSVTFEGIWNNETRKRELSFIFTAGMDDTAVCYIAVKHINEDKETFIGRYDLLGDRHVEASGLYDDAASRSIVTLKILISDLESSLLTVGGLLTTNHLIAPKFNNNRNNNNSSPKPSESTSSHDLDF